MADREDRPTIIMGVPAHLVGRYALRMRPEEPAQREKGAEHGLLESAFVQLVRTHLDVTGEFVAAPAMPDLKLDRWEWEASGPKAFPEAETEIAFNLLASEWRRSRDPYRSGTKSFMLPAYQMIIGLGPAAIPYILRELARAPEQWFWALKAISREDPVSPDAAGDVLRMRDAWLDWGRRRGL
jgi:hypothetical protein